MLKHRIALPLVAAALTVVAVSVIAWAISAPDASAERAAVPPLSWDSEPTAAPLEIGDDVAAAQLLEPMAEPVPAGLAAEPLAPPEHQPPLDGLFLAAGEAESGPMVSAGDVFGSDLAVASADDQPVLWADGAADKSLRNRDFPKTYISHIDVDLTSPHHWVRLTWTGPLADRQETGPFHSSPGAGLGNNDCDDVTESNRDGSNCTPKGEFAVEAFSDTMRTYTQCRFVTWINAQRGIAFHSYFDVPNYPASHGCVRLNEHAAQLIHNNSLMGMTTVTVGGTWTPR